MKKKLSVLLAAVMALSLTACGPKPPADNGSAQPAPTTAAPAETKAGETKPASAAITATAPETKATEAPQTASSDKYGGDISCYFATYPSTLWVPAQSGSGNALFMSPAVESLLATFKDGSFEMLLAESLDVDVEKKTATIKLREGVKFHDGSDLTAEVICWNLDMYKEEKKLSNFGGPTSWEAVDDLTVVVHYDDQWAPDIKETLGGKLYVVSKQAYEEHGADWCAANVVGTGPFKMESTIVDSEIKYVRFEDYWQKDQDGNQLPYLDSITMVSIKDANSRLAAFQAGDLDITQCSDTPTYSALSMTDCTFLGERSLGYTYGLFFNTLEAPFNDVKVRQAVAHALDGATIGNGLYPGLVAAVKSYGDSTCINYNEETVGYEYNVEKAKELLKEAGYENGFDTVFNCTESDKDLATAVQSYLKEVGINVEIKLVDNALLTDMKVNTGWTGMVSQNMGGSTDAVRSIFIQFLSSDYVRFGVSMEHYDDYDEAANKAFYAKDMEERKTYAKEADKLSIDKYCMYIPMYMKMDYYVSQPNIYDTFIREYSSSSWWRPAFAWKEK